MERAVLKINRETIEDAVARIQNVATYVDRLNGRAPKDLTELSMMRQQAEELRKGLIVLSSLADALQHLYDRQVVHRPVAMARAAPAAPRHKTG